MQLGAMHNIYYSYFGQSTRMVDSGIFIDKICWFYPNRESTFWTMHAILKLQVPILAMRNNKMGHRINKMWTLINKVGHRNVKLVVTYQQVGFKKQQNGSRVLYLLGISTAIKTALKVALYDFFDGPLAPLNGQFMEKVNHCNSTKHSDFLMGASVKFVSCIFLVEKL